MPGTPAAGTARRAVFADRDGTIIEDRNYVADPAHVDLIPGSAAALARLRALGFALVVVTNQSGIGRGLYTVADYRRVAAETDRRLERAGIVVDATRFCPDAPGGDPETTCRKPSPVMYRAAARDLGLTLRGSYYVGDKMSDVLPAQRLGGTGILVRTGHGTAEEKKAAAEGNLFAGLRVVDDLAAAAELIARLEGGRDPDAGHPVPTGSGPR